MFPLKFQDHFGVWGGSHLLTHPFPPAPPPPPSPFSGTPPQPCFHTKMHAPPIPTASSPLCPPPPFPSSISIRIPTNARIAVNRSSCRTIPTRLSQSPVLPTGEATSKFTACLSRCSVPACALSLWSPVAFGWQIRREVLHKLCNGASSGAQASWGQFCGQVCVPAQPLS